MRTGSATRLSAAERRQEIVETATHLFSSGSYRGVTTADIARGAGVSEPILYRHFPSKRDLYLACIEYAWDDLLRRWKDSFRDDPGAGWVPAMARAVQAKVRGRKAFLASFWVQALTEAGEDAEIRAFLRRHLRTVHGVVAGALRDAQEAGAVPRDRDPDAEAWIMIAGSLMLTFADRLGGLMSQDDLDRIAESRKRWLLGG